MFELKVRKVWFKMIKFGQFEVPTSVYLYSVRTGTVRYRYRSYCFYEIYSKEVCTPVDLPCGLIQNDVRYIGAVLRIL